MPPTECTTLTVVTMGATASAASSRQRRRSTLSLEEVLALYGPVGLSPVRSGDHARRTVMKRQTVPVAESGS